VQLDIDDMNLLKADRDLATAGGASGSTWIVLGDTAIEDMAANPATAVETTAAMFATTHIPDSTGPVLNSFTLNMNLFELALTFSETVDTSGINADQITFVSDNVDYPLVGGGGTKSNADSTVVTVIITPADMNAIKLNKDICTSEATTLVTISATLITDVLTNNPNDAIVDASPQQVSNGGFTNDNLGPDLESFDVDLTTGEMTLSFSETMDAGTIVSTGFVLQSDSTNVLVLVFEPKNALSRMPLVGSHAFAPLEASRRMTNSIPLGCPLPLTVRTFYDVTTPKAPAQSYQILNGAVTDVDSTVITMTLDRDDLNAVMKKSDLCIARGNCYLKVTNAGGDDMAGQPISVSHNEAVGFIKDTEAPIFNGWSLNVEAGTITMEFSETMLATSIKPTFIKIDGPGSSTGGVVLTDESTVVDLDDKTLTVNIFSTSLDDLKIFLSEGTTTVHMVMTVGGTTDMTANPVVGATRDVTSIQQDSTPPTLNSWELDVERGTITFHFSEIMKIQSLNRHFFAMVGTHTLNADGTYAINQGAPNNEIATPGTAFAAAGVAAGVAADELELEALPATGN
jgi:hypothetical protein